MIGRELPPLSARAYELLADERALGAEDAALKQRLVERAREALQRDRPSGIGLRVAGESSWPAAGAGRRAPRTVLFAAAAVAVASLAAAGAGIYSWRAPSSAVVRPLEVRSATVSRAVAPVEVAPVAPPSEVVEAVPAAPERARGPAPAGGAQASSIQTYALEAGLLEPARRAIASGNYAAGMAAIARHQREYARGQLAEEREALRVRALWGMGQKPAAESAAAQFRKRYPRSVLLSWMKEPAKPGP